MATSCNIHFHNRNESKFSNIYLSHEGYPESVLQSLDTLFDELLDLRDPRLDDAGRLAARFIIHLSRVYGLGISTLIVAVDADDAQGCEYVYQVLCHSDGTKKPTVTWSKVGE